MTIVSVKNIVKTFPVKKGVFSLSKKRIHAVNDISFEINAGETLAIVGESGCGKSTTGRLITRLMIPDSGEIWYNGQNISALDNKQMLPLRKQIQIIFQDPYSSLNPRMTAESIIAEPLLMQGKMRTSARRKAVHELMEIVGLPAEYGTRYPHEFSGGQRQRIGIARALVSSPRLVVADEPISALDVSIRAQILNLMQRLQKDFSLTYLFISHDLSIVEVISDRVAVMYLGSIVELGPKESLYKNPKHPYTKALLQAVPVPNPKLRKEKEILQGEIPSNIDMPGGCPFQTRCTKVKPDCTRGKIEPRDLGGSHTVACLYID